MSSGWLFLFIIHFLAFIRPSLAGIRGNADSFVTKYNILKDCPADKKNVLNLKTGAAIFYLNETEHKNKVVGMEDFLCHYELETPTGYGFHIYIDQMYLNDNGPLKNDRCQDWLQFAR